MKPLIDSVTSGRGIRQTTTADTARSGRAGRWLATWAIGFMIAVSMLLIPPTAQASRVLKITGDQVTSTGKFVERFGDVVKTAHGDVFVVTIFFGDDPSLGVVDRALVRYTALGDEEPMLFTGDPVPAAPAGTTIASFLELIPVSGDGVIARIADQDAYQWLLHIDGATNTIRGVIGSGQTFSFGTVAAIGNIAFEGGNAVIPVELFDGSFQLLSIDVASPDLPIALVPHFGTVDDIGAFAVDNLALLTLPDGTRGFVAGPAPTPETRTDDVLPSTTDGGGFALIAYLEDGRAALVVCDCIDDAQCPTGSCQDGTCVDLANPFRLDAGTQAKLFADNWAVQAEPKELFVLPDDHVTVIDLPGDDNVDFEAILAETNADGSPKAGTEEPATDVTWSVEGDIGILSSFQNLAKLKLALPEGSDEETGRVIARLGSDEASTTVTVKRPRFFVLPQDAVLDVGGTQTFETFMCPVDADGNPGLGPDGEPDTTDDICKPQGATYEVVGDIGTVTHIPPEFSRAFSAEFTATTPGTGQVRAFHDRLLIEATADVTVRGDAQLEYLDADDETVDQVTLFEPATSTANRLAGLLGAHATLTGVQAQVSGQDNAATAIGEEIAALEREVDGLLPADKRYRITGPGGASVVVTLTSRGVDGDVVDVCDVVLEPDGNGRLVSDPIVAVSADSGVPPSHTDDLHLVLAEEGGELTAEGGGFQAGTASVVAE